MAARPEDSYSTHPGLESSPLHIGSQRPAEQVFAGVGKKAVDSFRFRSETCGNHTVWIQLLPFNFRTGRGDSRRRI